MKKFFLSLSFAIIFAIGISAMPVQAVDNNNVTICDEHSDLLKTVGLIKWYSLDVSTSEKILYINGATLSNSVLGEIGFKNVKVYYSSDGDSWYEEENIGDLLKSNSSNYHLNNYTVSVNGGYYYRVTCTHYAKESGWFGKSQSEDNISNIVWVNK